MSPNAARLLIEALIALGSTRRPIVEVLADRSSGPGTFDALVMVPGVECIGDLVTVDEAKLAPDHRPGSDGEVLAGALGLAAEARLLDGNLAEAGRFAIEARSTPHLKRVIEMALRTTPPLVSLRELRR